MLKSAEGHAKTKKGLPKNFFSEQSLTLLDCKCKLCHVINAFDDYYTFCWRLEQFCKGLIRIENGEIRDNN